MTPKVFANLKLTINQMNQLIFSQYSKWRRTHAGMEKTWAGCHVFYDVDMDSVQQELQSCVQMWQYHAPYYGIIGLECRSESYAANRNLYTDGVDVDSYYRSVTSYRSMHIVYMGLQCIPVSRKHTCTSEETWKTRSGQSMDGTYDL